MFACSSNRIYQAGRSAAIDKRFFSDINQQVMQGQPVFRIVSIVVQRDPAAVRRFVQ